MIKLKRWICKIFGHNKAVSLCVGTYTSWITVDCQRCGKLLKTTSTMVR